MVAGDIQVRRATQVVQDTLEVLGLQAVKARRAILPREVIAEVKVLLVISDIRVVEVIRVRWVIQEVRATPVVLAIQAQDSQEAKAL